MATSYKHEDIAASRLLSLAGQADNEDVRSDAARHARHLIAMANELLAMAGELEDLASTTPENTDAGGYSDQDDDVRWGRMARKIYRDRRRRADIFGDENLFGEPAWDLLLDLFIAAKERKRVPVTSACIGAAVPTTTALRWLSVLEERGLVVREADPADARRIFVRLSTEAYARMVNFFARTYRAEQEEPERQQVMRMALR